MSQSSIVAALMLVGWLFALEFRVRIKPNISNKRFDLIQIGLVILTGIALVILIIGVSKGLLGHPEMSIMGNHSSAGQLKWYTDYSDPLLPRAGVLSIPRFFYRGAMLVWALWLAFYLLKILKWGWKNFSQPIIWRPFFVRKKKELKS